MLRLRKISLFGFKSFCDRTEFCLPGNGIAIVAGPNGCGKSNILDGMNWVLGEQRARNLRGAQMQDVIFSGTHNRRPLGVAEVTLTLVNPEEYEEPAAAGPDAAIEFGGALDWDEEEIRRKRAREAEEIVVAMQPGRSAREDTPMQPEMLPAYSQAVAGEKQLRKQQPAGLCKGEITITRRLFRTGESVYLLNGKPCRLRDLQELFLATGLGPDTYAIIGQEQIGQLLSSKPNDRQAVIEEAAGISGLKAQRRIAEARMENARESLARVDDIFEEVARQVASLKLQAAKAGRIAEARSELRERSQVAIASRMRLLDDELAHLELEIAALSANIGDALARIEAHEACQHSLTQQSYKHDQEGQEALGRVNIAAVELERAIAKQNDNAERLKELERRSETFGSELQQVQSELREAVAEREQQDANLTALTEQANGFRRNLEMRQQEVRNAGNAVMTAERQMEIGRRLATQLLVNAGDARNKMVQAEESLAMLERAAERIAFELREAQEELTHLNADNSIAAEQFEATSEAFLKMDRDLGAMCEALQTMRAKETAMRAQCNVLRAEYASALARHQALDTLLRERSYATDAIKQLLSPGALGEDVTPIGTLADFLEVSGAHEQIVDEFLRDELNYVVVDSWTTAETGVRLLKSRIDGRATFLVRSLSDSAEHVGAGEDRLLAGRSEVTPLKYAIHAQNGFGPFMEAVLPKLKYGYIVDNSADARRLAVEFPDAFFLTLQGECFHNLTVTCGSSASQGPLALRREQQEIAIRFAALESELAQADAENAALTTTIEQITEEIQARQGELRCLDTDRVNHGAVLKQAEAAIMRAERRLAELELQALRNREACTAKHSVILDTGEEAARLEIEKKAAEEALDEYQTEVVVLRQRQDNLQAEVDDAIAEMARLEERQRAAENALQHSSNFCKDREDRIRSIEEQRITTETEYKQRLHEADKLTTKIQMLMEQRAKFLAEKEEAAVQVHALRQQLSRVEADLKTERVAITRLQDGRASRSQEAAKVQADLEHCATNSLAELGVEAQILRANEAISRLTGDALTAIEEECRGLRWRIEQMGPVNGTALDEYQEAIARHSLLEAQRKDLLESMENAQTTIREIDNESRAKFDEALSKINENFDEVFGWLFHGGHALLRAIGKENSGESGLEIIASPPGKKLQNAQLLSGGEKALTALALLVAIFQYRPSPFCVLDEIDAPLDEANISRFADLMRTLSQGTQFVVVTHSKLMMQSADVIFGITMQEPGISKMLSLRLDRQ